MFRNVFKALSLLFILTMFESLVYAHSDSVLMPIGVSIARSLVNATEGAEMSASQAIVDAERDAAVDANSVLWLGGTFIGTSLVGCLFCGLPSILIASIYQPTPPAARLMGKSPEYIMLYTQTYKEKTKSRQMRDATIGCVGGSLVAAFIWSRYYSGEWSNY